MMRSRSASSELKLASSILRQMQAIVMLSVHVIFTTSAALCRLLLVRDNLGLVELEEVLLNEVTSFHSSSPSHQLMI